MFTQNKNLPSAIADNFIKMSALHSVMGKDITKKTQENKAENFCITILIHSECTSWKTKEFLVLASWRIDAED